MFDFGGNSNTPTLDELESMLDGWTSCHADPAADCNTAFAADLATVFHPQMPEELMCKICVDEPLSRSTGRFQCAHGDMMCDNCEELSHTCPFCRAPAAGDAAHVVPQAATPLADGCALPLPEIDGLCAVEFDDADCFADIGGSCSASPSPSPAIGLDFGYTAAATAATLPPPPPPPALSPSPSSARRAPASRRSEKTSSKASSKKASRKPYAAAGNAKAATPSRFEGSPSEQGGFTDDEICNTAIGALKKQIATFPAKLRAHIIERRKQLQNRLHARRAAKKRGAAQKDKVQRNAELAATCASLQAENQTLRQTVSQMQHEMARRTAAEANRQAEMLPLQQELARLQAQLALRPGSAPGPH